MDEKTFIPVKKPSLWTRFIKRTFDICSSGAVILVLLPFFLLFTPIVAIAMKGNPFFVQKRPGKDGKIFDLIKYRTMTNAKDKDGNLLPDADRLTKFGKFLRSTSLDELPELFCIFSGKMSVVGPRPQLVRDMAFMTEEQKQRHVVRPGLTGLAQINGRNNITWEQKFQYDLEYINSGITLLKDLKIIFRTAGKTVEQADTVREGTVSDIDYGDWLLQEGKITKEEYSTIIEKYKI